jgi:hypothetical protein
MHAVHKESVLLLCALSVTSCRNDLNVFPALARSLFFDCDWLTKCLNSREAAAEARRSGGGVFLFHINGAFSLLAGFGGEMEFFSSIQRP